MEHVKVDDEMKNRILQNIENETKDAGTSGGAESEERSVENVKRNNSDKIRPFSSRFGAGLRRYGGLAAMFAVLIVAAAAVIQITGDIKNTSTISYDSAPAATGMMESESAAEAPASAESESPMYDSDFAAESPMEEAEYAADSAMNEAEFIAEEPDATETAVEAPVSSETESALEAPSYAEKQDFAKTPSKVEKSDDALNLGHAQNIAGSAPASEVEPATDSESVTTAGTETITTPAAENEEAPKPGTAKVLFAVLLPVLLLAAIVTVVILVIRKIRKRKE